MTELQNGLTEQQIRDQAETDRLWKEGEERMNNIAKNHVDGLQYCSGCVSLCDGCAGELPNESPNNTHGANPDLNQWIFDTVTGKTTGKTKEHDPVNHPSHYTSHPSGIETIQITECMNFCLGNAIKYIMRCEHKDNKKQDIEKAIWYLQRELER